MRITYLHQYFNTPEQSGGTRSYEFARRLVARGHAVTMITSDRSGQAKAVREELVDGIRVLWLPVAYDNSMGYSRRIASFAAFAVQSARLASAQRCDVVYATSTPLTIAIPAMYASWRLRVPWVLEVRDLWPEIPISMGAIPSKIMQRAAFMLADRAYGSAVQIVALSPGMARGIAARGVSPAKVTAIPNGCDLDLFSGDRIDRHAFRRAHPELGGRRVVLYAGTIGKANGLEYMVDMAQAARSLADEVVFVVVGSGGQAHAIIDRARRASVLERNFFIFPSVSKANVANVIASADVTLSLVTGVATLNDNSANKFFDSLAAGKPIAINHEGWLADLIREHGVGLVLPSHDAVQAATSLTRFVLDQRGLEKAGRAASRLAATAFARDDLALALERVVARAVSIATTGGAV